MSAHTMDHRIVRGTTATMPHDQAIERTCAALRDHGLCVLDRIDVRGQLKERFNPRFHPYLILSACDRAVVHRALQGNPDNLLLICNVVVYDNGDGTSTAETLNPPAPLGLPGDDPAIAIAGREPESGLRGVVDSRGRSEE